MPGLKVVYPATPYDAKGLLASALSGDDPVVFFESQRLYDAVETVHEGGVPTEYYQLPIGDPDVKREGSDVTILTIGPSLYPALAAADELAAEHGVSAEIIDARSLVPFDYETVLESVKKTGRILLVSEASERGSFPMTLAANIGRYAFGDLKAAPRVLGSPNWIVPGAEMESTYFPQAHDIVDIVCCELIPEKNTDWQGLRGWDDLELGPPRPVTDEEKRVDVPIVMPQLGNDIEEAQIDEWLKAEGDAVSEGEQIVIVTTPKLTMELEAPATGVLK